MPTNRINLLIIEDCPFTCQGYKHLLENSLSTPLHITFANNCDTAVQHIKSKTYELIVLDLQLPISKNEHYLCGEDLGLLIRNTQKDTKIIVSTNISEGFRINSIIDELNPEGFIIKAKSDPKDLKKVIELVLEGHKYFCKSVEEYTQHTSKNITIDDFDRQILYHLSMGVKTKDLCKHITLSHRTIEVRKAKLKSLLNINNAKHFSLVKEAKKLGFI
ncbi:response regulator [Algibacter sp. 2305UL17-15]|uniref:response regulator n=1 Tax=Algibacter sp. 2305UL17-15 TaxID=3231268 RepID=UPI0034595FE4